MRRGSPSDRSNRLFHSTTETFISSKFQCSHIEGSGILVPGFAGVSLHFVYYRFTDCTCVKVLLTELRKFSWVFAKWRRFLQGDAVVPSNHLETLSIPTFCLCRDFVMEILRQPVLNTYVECRIDDHQTQWKVWFTVHSSRGYPYHFTPVQVFHEGDPIRRVDFCRFMLHRDAEDPYFLKSILWTDESKFDQDGITNYHNIYYWAPKVDENPNKKKETESQRRFALNRKLGEGPTRRIVLSVRGCTATDKATNDISARWMSSALSKICATMARRVFSKQMDWQRRSDSVAGKIPK
ncbi:hypothetical protein EVAR_67371_1 [Eumeta japonica]|uniref:Uncharacterized protein n=1 Tax=Eumeta variegata TaxID=151549 RepID=A0A4C1ZV22_EUMVA|nr:hypothetical protein EVAR_67371_1 [Eumeta japonica]